MATTRVVGGSPGIGSTLAERFREEGAEVLVADLRGGDVEVDVRDASLATARLRPPW